MMAIIPKYTQQRSIPGTTGQQMAPLSLVGESPMKTIGDVGSAAMGVLAEAGQRIQKRESTINRAKDYSNFQRDVGTEWQRVQDQEDLSNPSVLANFNKFVTQKRSEMLIQHVGDAESLAKLTAKTEEMSGLYERTAIGSMRSAQIDTLRASYEDQINPILTAVSNGTMDVDAGLLAVSALSDDLGGSDEDGWNIPRKMAFDMHDAAQSAVAIASVERHLSGGNWMEAQKELDRNPHFDVILDTKQLQGLHKRISDQRFAYDLADQKAQRALNIKAQENGFSSWAEMPPHMKFTPITDIGKRMQERTVLGRLYGEGHPIINQYDALSAATTGYKAQSSLGKLIADQRGLASMGRGPGDPEFDAVTAKINSENPEFVKAQEKVDKFPSAQIALSTFTRRAETMRDDAKKAIMLWTGKGNWKDAQKHLVDIKEQKGDWFGADYAMGTSGLGQAGAQFLPGSDINEIQAILTRIGGKQLIDALSALKAASPTGASGMGALNETEGKALMFQEGALDIQAPAATIETLMGIIDNTDTAINNQTSIFNKAFSPVDKVEGGGASLAAQAPVSKEASKSGRVRYGLTAKPLGGADGKTN